MRHSRALTLDTVISASPEQVSCELDNEIVLLSLRTGEYYGLNPVAARIWQLIQHPCAILEVRDRLLIEYADVTPRDCEVQVLALLEEMVSLDLIRRSAENPPRSVPHDRSETPHLGMAGERPRDVREHERAASSNHPVHADHARHGAANE